MCVLSCCLNVFQRAEVFACAVGVHEADANSVDIAREPGCCFSISGVFISVDDGFQKTHCQSLWELECQAQGEGLLWYDFIYNNPGSRTLEA
jgi:hypothetical protein